MAVESRNELADLLKRGSPLDCAFQCLNEAIVIIDQAKRLVYCSDRYYEETGYTPEEIIGGPLGQLVSGEAHRSRVIQSGLAALEGQSSQIQVPVLRKDGVEIWAEVRAGPFRDTNGSIIGMVAACTNITKAHRTAESLEQAVKTGEGELELAIGALEREVEERHRSERVALGQKKVLCDILDALIANPDLDSFFEVLLQAINEALDSPSSGLWFREDASDRAVLYTTYPTDHRSKYSGSIKLDRPAYENLFVKHTAHLVDVPKRMPTLPPEIQEMYVELGVKATLVVPIMRSGEAIGFISIRRHERDYFAEAEIELAVALGDIASLATELKRLAEESRHTAVHSERNRFAREIHDTLAQEFAGVMLHASAAKQSIEDGLPASATKHLNEVKNLASEGLSEARRSVFALRSAILDDSDLGTALTALAKRLRVPGVRIKPTIKGASFPMAPEVESNLLRIAQEATGNAVRHSKSKRIDISLDYRSPAVEMVIKDDGAGFDIDEAKGKGFGLQSMAERATTADMIFEIHSELGKGVTITVKAAHALLRDRQ
jgi:PAS domain S-box-containing protein